MSVEVICVQCGYPLDSVRHKTCGEMWPDGTVSDDGPTGDEGGDE